jgi:hypothetical protein
MGLSFKITPKTWFERDVSFSLQLLLSFVQNTEQQIKMSWADYQNNQEEIQTDEDSEFPNFVVLYQGLDSMTYDLEGIFRDHFPNIQRRAALITLFSFLESELDKLCLLFQKTNEYPVSLKDLNGNGIERSSLYLEKVCDLKDCRNLPDWLPLKDIQKIRNIVVHNDGKLYDLNNNPRETEIKIVKKSDHLTEEYEGVILKDSYLLFVLNSFTRYFTDLDRLIKSVNKTMPSN